MASRNETINQIGSLWSDERQESESPEDFFESSEGSKKTVEQIKLTETRTTSFHSFSKHNGTTIKAIKRTNITTERM